MHHKFIHGGGIALLLAGVLSFSACGGSSADLPAAPEAASPEASTASQPAAAESPAEQPTQAVAPATESAPATSSAEATDKSLDAAQTVAALAECETVNIPNDEKIPAASADEWALGPADAPLTLIEYGDFQ